MTMREQTETTVDTTNFEALLAQISENGAKIASNIWAYNLTGLIKILNTQSTLYAEAAAAVEQFMHEDGIERPTDES